MERFALKVDLSEISDLSVHHVKVMILVDPQWENVAAIESKIKTMFNIDIKIGFKSSEGFYIPLDEPVEILKYVEMIKAFIVEPENINQSKRKSRLKSISDPKIKTTEEFISDKKRKYGFLNEENFTTSTPHVAKRLKNAKDALPPVVEQVQDTSEERSKKKSKKSSPNKTLHEISNQQKTKSLSKSKDKEKTMVSEVEKLNSKSKSHVFFNDNSKAAGPEPEQENNEELEKSKMEIIFLCELTDSELTGRGRSFQIGNAMSCAEGANNQDTKKIEHKQNHVSIIENLTLVKERNHHNVDVNQTTVASIDSPRSHEESRLEQSSKPNECTESLISCDDESAVIEINESEKSVLQNSTNLTCSQQENEDSSIRQSNCNEFSASSFANSTELSLKAVALTDLPNINDQLIFKIKLSNEKMSEDFVGICEYVNKRLKSIKIRLLDGQSQMRYLPQKYAGNVDDSNASTIINIKLSEMIEPRVLCA